MHECNCTAQSHGEQSSSRTVNFFHCAGGAVGLAVSAAVLQATLRSHLLPELSHFAHSAYSLPVGAASGADLKTLISAYMSASRAVFILQVPLIGLCLLGCLLVRDHGLQHQDDTDSAPHQDKPTNTIGNLNKEEKNTGTMKKRSSILGQDSQAITSETLSIQVGQRG